MNDEQQKPERQSLSSEALTIKGLRIQEAFDQETPAERTERELNEAARAMSNYRVVTGETEAAEADDTPDDTEATTDEPHTEQTVWTNPRSVRRGSRRGKQQAQ